MPRKKYTPEQIIQKLREAEIRQGQGETLDQVCRGLAISEQTFFYRWRKEFGGLQLHKLTDLKRLSGKTNCSDDWSPICRLPIASSKIKLEKTLRNRLRD